MEIMAVDNQCDRLEELAACLRTAFPEAEIVTFTEPGLAVQYTFKKHVDLVFAERYMRRLDGIQVAEGIHFFCPEAMIYLVYGEGTRPREIKQKAVTGYFIRPLSAGDIQKRVETENAAWKRKFRTGSIFAATHSGARRKNL